MYETVKTVKGYAIQRMIGTHGFYRVVTKCFENGSSQYYTFRTIKSATEFIGKTF